LIQIIVEYTNHKKQYGKGAYCTEQTLKEKLAGQNGAYVFNM